MCSQRTPARLFQTVLSSLLLCQVVSYLLLLLFPQIPSILLTFKQYLLMHLTLLFRMPLLVRSREFFLNKSLLSGSSKTFSKGTIVNVITSSLPSLVSSNFTTVRTQRLPSRLA